MMKKYINIIWNDLQSIFSLKTISMSIFVFILVDIITTGLHKSNNLNDLIKYSFYGTNDLTDEVIELLSWLLCQLFLVYTILNFINYELKKRITIVLLKTGSRTIWLRCMAISIFIYSALYFILGFAVLIILNLNLLSSPVNFVNLFQTLLTLILTGFSVCLSAFILSLLIESEPVILAVLMFLQFLCIAIGGKFKRLDKYFLFNQSILVKHYESNISFTWTYIYDIAFSLLFYFITCKLIKRRDL